MAQKPLEEIAWMKRLIEIAFFLRGGAVPRDSKTHNALHRPSRCLQQQQNCWEAPRNTSIYWAGSEEMASEPVASACQGLTLEIRRLPKKGVSHRLAPKMVQTWVDLFRNSIQIFSFCSSIEPSSRFFKPFQLPLRTPSLGCASEGVGYRFPVLVQGHRAHAAIPRWSRTPKRSPGPWRRSNRCRTCRRADSSRNSSAPPLEGLMASTLKSSRTMRGRGGSRMTIREYMWRIVRKNWGISLWRNLMKLII